jgi:hypothetical protein
MIFVIYWVVLLNSRMPAFKVIFGGISGRIIVKTILFFGSAFAAFHFLFGCFFCLGFRFCFGGLFSILALLFCFFK